MAFQVIESYKTFLFKAVWMDYGQSCQVCENIEMVCALFGWQQARIRRAIIGGVLFYLKI